MSRKGQKLEMCPVDMDAPAREMSEISSSVYTAQWK